MPDLRPHALALRPLSAALSCVCLLGLALGEEPPLELEPYVVRSPADAGDTARTETVLNDRLEIADELGGFSQSPVDGLLERNPGFSLFRSSGSGVAHPTSQGVSLRGIQASGASRSLVLYDGIPLNDPFGGWIYFSRLDPALLESVSFDYGGSSGLWGNYSLAGVVELATRSELEDHRSATLSFGSHGWRAGSLLWSGPAGPARALVSARRARFGGFIQTAPSQRGAIDERAGFDANSVEARLAFAPGEDSSLSWRVSAFEESRRNGTPLSRNETEAIDLQARYGRRLEGFFDALEARALYQRRDFANQFAAASDDRSSERAVLDQFDVPAESFGGSLTVQRKAEGARPGLTLGIDYRETEAETNERFRNLGQGFTRRREAGGRQRFAGGFARVEGGLPGDWRYELGGRIERVAQLDGRLAVFSLEEDGPPLEEDIVPRRGTTVQEALARLSRSFGEQRVELALQTSYRAPNLNELYRPFRVGNDIVAENPFLEEERLDLASVGWRWQRDRASARLRGYWGRARDLVGNAFLAFGPGLIDPCGFTPGDGTCSQRLNVGRSRVRGAEAAFEAPLARSLELDVFLAYYDSEIRSFAVDPSIIGSVFPQSPRFRSRVALVWGPAESLRVEASWSHRSQSYEDLSNRRRLEGYEEARLRASWSLDERWTLLAEIDNLFDQRRRTALSSAGDIRIGPPRSFRLSLTWRP